MPHSAEPIVLLVEITVVAGGMERFLEHADEHARISLNDEPGCLQFDIVREDEVRAVIYEVYRDRAALEDHRSRPQLQRFRELTKDLVAELRVRELSRASDGRPRRKGRVLCAVTSLTERRELLRGLVEAGYEVVYNETGKRYDALTLKALLPGISATIAGTETYDAEILAAAPDLRIVARMGVGYDQVNVPACTEAGVAVAMAFGANHEAVADHALALMGALSSSLPTYDARVRGGKWGTLNHARLHKTTVGIIGFGRIGKAVAKRCQGFSARVIAYDPLIDQAVITGLGAEPAALDTLLAEADFVTLHAPALPATRHMIDAAALARMKPTAYLINTARGPLVDEAALVQALAEGAIAGAGLDVFEIEPLPASSPLHGLDNVILTPHIAGVSDSAVAAMAEKCVDNILAYLEGRALEPGLILNPEVAG